MENLSSKNCIFRVSTKLYESACKKVLFTVESWWKVMTKIANARTCFSERFCVLALPMKEGAASPYGTSTRADLVWFMQWRAVTCGYCHIYQGNRRSYKRARLWKLPLLDCQVVRNSAESRAREPLWGGMPERIHLINSNNREPITRYGTCRAWSTKNWPCLQ